jgi:hypothetical protein
MSGFHCRLQGRALGPEGGGAAVATWGRGGVGLKALFPGQTGPVAATWFTGKLKLPPSARALNPQWPNPLDEKYLMITVEKGRVVSQEVVANCGGICPPGL